MPARILTSLNRKGGVGKTHICWLLASVALENRKRVLLVDLDPQANLTSSFMTQPAESGVEQLFDPSAEPEISQLIQATNWPEIDIIPAGVNLEAFNLSDPNLWEQADLHLALVDSISALAERYDFIVFDCPPNLSLTSTAALCASDGVIIPLEAARWGALGTQQIVSAMDQIRKTHNSRLQLVGYVGSRFKTRRSYQDTYMKELRHQFGDLAFETVIPDLAAFEKSVTDRIPLTIHSPKSYASDIARRFYAEVVERCERLA